MRVRDKERAAAKEAKEKQRQEGLLLVIRRTFAEVEGGEFAGISNAALAARAGVSRRTFQRWLNRAEFIRGEQIAGVAVRKERERRQDIQLADLQARLNALIKQHRAERARMPHPF